MLRFLESIADFAGIERRWEDIHSRHPDYDGYAVPGRRLIVLDVSIRGTRQEKCVLAEEIGHCLYPPAADHTLYHSTKYWGLGQWERSTLRCQVAKDERAALEWASSVLIPDWSFWEFARGGGREWWEWLEHFGVTDWMMRVKVGLVRARMRPQAKRMKWRELVRRD